MKKLIARILLACMLLSVLAVLPALPTGAAESRLSTDKTTYTVGEPILVTATGSNADWVGLYQAGDAYDPNNGGIASIYWYYVSRDGNTSGDAKNIYRAEYNNLDGRPEFSAKVPAGEYKIALMENDGYSVLEEVFITIVEGEAPAEPDTPDTPAVPEDGEWTPTEEKPIVTDRTEYRVGEDILVRALGSGLDWVGLYRVGDPVGTVASIYWFYVEEEEHKAGDIRNLFEERLNEGRFDTAELPAGEYVLYLLADDGYGILSSVDITVVDDGTSIEVPVAPKSAAYQSANAGLGRADGTLTIVHGEKKPEKYTILWANADGPLAGYTEVSTIACTGAETVYTVTPNTLVPLGADRLLVYAVNGKTRSDKPAVAKLPDGAGSYDLGKPLAELQVMSDIHINPSDNHIHNKHFAAALADIKKLAPNSIGIFVNGDVADHGQRNEYDALNRLVKAAGEGLPPVYYAIGNHDICGGQSAEAQIAQFLKGTNNDSETVYFEREIGGYRFIFLGGETVSGNASLSRAQLDWLEETLDKESDGKPVFVFLHQGIMDMVAGTFQYQGWHGVDQAGQLKKILKDHPEVIMFAGHSHWTLESKQSIKPADEEFPTVLNTSSCAYLWDDDANKTNIGIEGSQGYYIYIYEDRMVFLGRDFVNGLWTSSAQFVMDWSLTSTDQPVDPAESETEDPNPSETEDPESDTVPAPVESDPVPETSADTDASSSTSAVGGADESDLPDEGGCASALGAGALLTVLSLGVTMLRRRRD